MSRQLFPENRVNRLLDEVSFGETISDPASRYMKQAIRRNQQYRTGKCNFSCSDCRIVTMQGERC